jgi:hypothetical protein
MKKQFNEYMETEAPIQLKVLFHEMDESQAIMLQECFHAFARKVVSDVQSKNGKLPIQNVSVPLPVIMQVLKYCEDNQIYDKLGTYQNFYYKLNQIRRECEESNAH